MDWSSIGRNIRYYRLEQDLRQEDLAEAIGLSGNYIGMVERGEKIPSLETLVAILNVLHISADMVLTDVVDTGYTVKQSMLAERIGRLPAAERERIYAVVDLLVRYADR
ncbi:helix-turn-helix transcriptional regulator [uncultured Subdoligranulum sp.]|uniref:helix-turn-helix domain-containing protein n=1 Tax=uncultured Subdoligranulum sp. TaxID=512298 RepID=UPI00263351B1|nr:helix-turn-helix transcriptional regulator [uncultured Subdoligranulum sp.]